MARYFFDHSIGEHISLDETGFVCRNDKAAVRTGRVQLANLLSVHDSELGWQHFQLIVRREDGVHVGRIGMTIMTETQNPVSAAALPFKTPGNAKVQEHTKQR